MRLVDINSLTHFIVRTGMYIGKESKESILSFVVGYQTGTEGKCSFESFSCFLSEEYGYKKEALSWWGQIQEYAIKHDVTWELSFKRLLLTYFYASPHYHTEAMFVKTHKVTIVSLIKRIDVNLKTTHFKNHYNNWKSFVILDSIKFKNSWSKDELKKIIELDNQFKKISTD